MFGRLLAHNKLAMLNRGAAGIVDSKHKLEDIERQLKGRLEKAKEIASCYNLDEANDKTQDELMS